MSENAVQNALLQGLEPAARQLLLRNAERKHFDTGHLFFRMGSPSEYVYFPEIGVASLVARTEDGDQIETGVIGHEGAVGLPEALARAEMFPHVTVQVAGEFWKVNAAGCRNAFGSEPGRTAVERYAQFSLAEARQSVACIAFHTLERRLARWLWTCWSRANAGNEIAITHEYMSAMLGSRRASVTETLPKLFGAGIRTARGKIIVEDPKALANASCECLSYIEDLRSALFRPAVSAAPQH